MNSCDNPLAVPPGDLLRLAQLLAHLRASGRGIPVNAAEALLLIGAGVDHVAELQKAMPDEQGQPLPGATAARLVGLLRGRARYAAGRWIESPFALVETRRHPHRGGQQLLLSDQGRQLLNRFLAGNEGAGLTSN
jgi:hypothetical protein